MLGEGSLCLVLHLFHSLPTLSRYWAAQRSNTTARRRITADRANRAAHPDASSNTPSTPDAAAPAEESGHASSGGHKGEDDATASRRGVKGIPVPPIMPASPLIADSPMTRAELLAVFRLLQRYGFLDFDGSTECYSLREPLLIDYLYTSIPFRQRVAFHGLAAEWMLEYTGHKMGNAALLYPLLMHHLSMAFQEARSAAIMNLLQVRPTGSRPQLYAERGQNSFRWLGKRLPHSSTYRPPFSESPLTLTGAWPELPGDMGAAALVGVPALRRRGVMRSHEGPGDAERHGLPVRLPLAPRPRPSHARQPRGQQGRQLRLAAQE
jgi:hypothetical protein